MQRNHYTDARFGPGRRVNDGWGVAAVIIPTVVIIPLVISVIAPSLVSAIAMHVPAIVLVPATITGVSVVFVCQRGLRHQAAKSAEDSGGRYGDAPAGVEVGHAILSL
jgi:hypothetical protein